MPQPIHRRIVNGIASLARRLGDALGAVTRRIENAFSSLAATLFEAFDSFSGLESVVVRAIRWVFWPLVAIGGWFSARLPQRSPGKAGGLGSRVWVGTLTLAERVNLDGALKWLAWLSTPLWWPIATVLGFVNAWLQTRRLRDLALAVPVLLLAAPFIYVAITASGVARNDIARHYEEATKVALKEGDYELGLLLERKLAQLGIDTRRTEYRAAEAIAEDGDLTAAYARMVNLAPTDTPGYPEAHAWIATRLVNRELGEEHDERLSEDAFRYELAEKHLDQLEELSSGAVGIDYLRAMARSGRGLPREAAEILKPHAGKDLGLAAMRLQLLYQARDYAAARDQARTVVTLADAEDDAALGAELMPSLALAGELVGDEGRVERIVNRWCELAPEDPTPRGLLRQLRERQLERLLATSSPSPAGLVDRLKNAAEAGVAAELLLAKVREVSSRGASYPNFQAAWQRLLELRAGPPELLISVGTQAAVKGKIREARGVFAALTEQGVDRPMVWNNLAWTLHQAPEPDYEAALAAADRAIALEPRDHRYRETRGQVLALLQRWEEAVTDLEFALNRMPDSTEIHATLATAYEALSRPNLAKVHRDRAGG